MSNFEYIPKQEDYLVEYRTNILRQKRIISKNAEIFIKMLCLKGIISAKQLKTISDEVNTEMCDDIVNTIDDCVDNVANKINKVFK